MLQHDPIVWPFPLPNRFVEQLGYPRVVEAFESPAMRAQLAELLRQQGIDDVQLPPATGPRPFLMLHWEPAGDELAWSDGIHGGAGQLDHWPYLDYLHEPAIRAWLLGNQVDLGSSDGPATHALVVHTGSGMVWVATIALARRIVREQRLQEGRP